MELSKEILTFLLAMVPIGELRFSIPLAVGVYKLSLTSAVIWSVLGNLVITWLLAFYLKPAINFLKGKSRLLDRPINWLLERTRNRSTEKYLKYGQWVLVVFVAIPLPGTGAWTGSIIAYLFDIPKWQTFLLISLGVILAGLGVTLATAGVIASIKIF